MLVVDLSQSHIDISCAWTFFGKVNDLGQPMYECPFCDVPAWRSRYLLWRHMHECIRKQKEYIPDISPPSVGIKREEMVVTA